MRDEFAALERQPAHSSSRTWPASSHADFSCIQVVWYCASCCVWRPQSSGTDSFGRIRGGTQQVALVLLKGGAIVPAHVVSGGLVSAGDHVHVLKQHRLLGGSYYQIVAGGLHDEPWQFVQTDAASRRGLLQASGPHHARSRVQQSNRPVTGQVHFCTAVRKGGRKVLRPAGVSRRQGPDARSGHDPDRSRVVAHHLAGCVRRQPLRSSAQTAASPPCVAHHARSCAAAPSRAGSWPTRC